jgi:iron complex transport system substrate-binding protein
MKPLVIGFACLALFIVFWHKEQRPQTFKLLKPKDYQRVVSLAPSMSETMVYLEQEHRLVGTTIHCQNPKFSKTQKIGSFAEPNYEAIMALNPDLVLAVPHIMVKNLLLELAARKIEIFAHQPDTLDDIKHIVWKLAQALDVEIKGIEVNQKIDRTLLDARHQIENARRSHQNLSVLIAVAAHPFVVAGKNSFPSQIIESLGFVNMADNTVVNWPVWPTELLITKPPQFIILTNPDDIKGYENLLSSLKIKPHNLKLVIPKKSIFKVPSPSIIDDISYLTTILPSVL